MRYEGEKMTDRETTMGKISQLTDEELDFYYELYLIFSNKDDDLARPRRGGDLKNRLHISEDFDAPITCLF